MRLRIINMLAIAVVALSSQAAVEFGQSPPPLTISISVVNPTVKVGTEIRIHVVLRNVSDKAMLIPTSPDPSEAELHYRVQVRDKSEKDAPETTYGHTVRTTGFSGSEMKISLQPGGTLEQDTLLRKLFDLSTPGVYEVQLSRRVPYDPNGETVKSNMITITVTP